MYWQSVKLSPHQRAILSKTISEGPEGSRKVYWSRVLMWLDRSDGGPGLSDLRVAETLRLPPQTVQEIGRLFNHQGLEAALAYKPPRASFRWHKEKDAVEERVVALAASEVPEGRERWSVRLLAEAAVARKLVESISHTTIHRILKKRDIRLERVDPA